MMGQVILTGPSLKFLFNTLFPLFLFIGIIVLAESVLLIYKSASLYEKENRSEE